MSDTIPPMSDPIPPMSRPIHPASVPIHRCPVRLLSRHPQVGCRQVGVAEAREAPLGDQGPQLDGEGGAGRVFAGAGLSVQRVRVVMDWIAGRIRPEVQPTKDAPADASAPGGASAHDTAR